ncbi:hypothetical protein [Hymenobacter negativus]|uniref:Uncharacterized protein n=1 Tax=Hymenobacter negativus TaxID=2795026 RepID=A0ABS3QI19_9BACT|nr:hypothetical protein [Hymenobacter negativus]MBO2010889.1 hypothetical protein [Hymenobacter negativus]
MTRGITLALAQRTNAIARCYHPLFYTSINELIADLPASGQHPGGAYIRRAVKVWFPEGSRVLNVVYCEHAGDDAALLDELRLGLDAWEALGQAPEDSFFLTTEEAERLLGLVTHPLTAPADRREVLRKLLPWHNRREARALTADLTAKIEARSPGILTGRGWMPHGPAEPKPSPHPFAA